MKELLAADSREYSRWRFSTTSKYVNLEKRRAGPNWKANRLRTSAGKAATEQARIAADLDATSIRLQQLQTRSAEMIRDARRIKLLNGLSRLKTAGQIAEANRPFPLQEVEKKEEIAYSVGKTSINVQMERADIEILERLLRQVVEERERLKVEFNTKPRVKIWGAPNAPADVPEHPD